MFQIINTLSLYGQKTVFSPLTYFYTSSLGTINKSEIRKESKYTTNPMF